MLTYVITDNASEKILLRKDELNDRWALVSERKYLENGLLKDRRTIILNLVEARKLAETILEAVKCIPSVDPVLKRVQERFNTDVEASSVVGHAGKIIMLLDLIIKEEVAR